MQTGAPEHERPWNLTHRLCSCDSQDPRHLLSAQTEVPPPANRPSLRRSAPGLAAPCSPPAFETPLNPVPYLGGLLSTIQGIRQPSE